MKLSLTFLTLISATAINAGVLLPRTSDCPVTQAEREKYLDNLEKQAAGNCGQGCEDSLASFQSKNSRCQNAGRNIDNGKWDFDHASNLGSLERRDTKFISRQVDCPVTDAEREKYRDNLEKQAAGNCGSGCLNSIASFQAKDSRCSQAAAAQAQAAANCPSAADRQKYLDNLEKQALGQCGDGCQASISSYQARLAKCQAAGGK